MNQVQRRLDNIFSRILRWIAFLTMLIWPEETAITFREENGETS